MQKIDLEPFLDSFLEWKAANQNCPGILRAMNNLPFCLMNGGPCCFEKCPRWIYGRKQEVILGSEKEVQESSANIDSSQNP